jgi:hypothetical protein
MCERGRDADLGDRIEELEKLASARRRRPAHERGEEL